MSAQTDCSKCVFCQEHLSGLAGLICKPDSFRVDPHSQRIIRNDFMRSEANARGACIYFKPNKPTDKKDHGYLHLDCRNGETYKVSVVKKENPSE